MKHRDDSGRVPSPSEQVAGTMFDAPPVHRLARADDPRTSKDAAVKAQSFAGRQHKKILSVLADAGYVGKTAKEIAKVTGYTMEQVCRRLPELRRADQAVAFDGRDGRPLIKRDDSMVHVIARDFFTAKVVLGQQQVAERMSA